MSDQNFGEEIVPEQQDSTVPVNEDVMQSHVMGQSNTLQQNVYDQHKDSMSEADRTHQLLIAQQQQIDALLKRVEKAERPAPAEPEAPEVAGGEPVPHHLHLADGRVVVNHGGIGTHYGETLDDGSQRITRVVNYYPVETIDPSTLNN